MCERIKKFVIIPFKNICLKSKEKYDRGGVASLWSKHAQKN